MKDEERQEFCFILHLLSFIFPIKNAADIASVILTLAAWRTGYAQRLRAHLYGAPLDMTIA